MTTWYSTAVPTNDKTLKSPYQIYKSGIEIPEIISIVVTEWRVLLFWTEIYKADNSVKSSSGGLARIDGAGICIQILIALYFIFVIAATHITDVFLFEYMYIK